MARYLPGFEIEQGKSMTTTTNPIEGAIVEQATAALTALGQERDEAIEAVRASYAVREERIRNIVEGLAAQPVPEPAPKAEPVVNNGTNGHAEAPAVAGLSVGKDRLKKIEGYVKKRGSARQADIQRDLGFNSGTISVGLRILAEQGKMRKGLNEDGSDQKVKGSTIWFHTSPSVAKGRRAEEAAAA
jgi:uncharacterized membrane protein